MLYAVTIDPIPAVFFLAEPPGNGAWEVQDGVELDVPTNLYGWPEGSERPQQVLARSAENPKHYKVFRYAREVAPGGFLATGKTFGGVYSMPTWERFIKDVLPEERRFRSIPADDESPGVAVGPGNARGTS